MPRPILIVIAGVIVVLAAVALIVPALIPAEVYRNQIETRASALLGRQLAIAGPVRVAVLPSIQARADAVTIANAEGFGDEPFAQVEQLRARLALLPLLSRRVEIREFVLMRPEIALEVDRSGGNNWTFSSTGSSSPAAGSGGGLVRRPSALPFDAALGDVRIVDGRASYVDRAAGAEHTIADLDLNVHMPDLSAPLRVEGGFDLDGDPVRLEARLDSLRSFFDGAAAPFFARVDAGVLILEADGRFEPDEAVSFSGDVHMASNDLKALAAKAGASLPPGDAYRRFDIRGRAVGDASRVAFEEAELAFDEVSGAGELVADLSGARPSLTGELVMGALDLTPYIPAGGGPGEAGGGAGGGVAPWSEEPIDFGPLKAIDADLRLSVRSLKAQAFEFGRSRIRARLEGGRLQVDLEELDTYEGTGAAEVIVDASGATPRVSLSAGLANIQARPFLVAAADFGRLTGVGGGRLNLAGGGRTQAAIMRSLEGAGSFEFRDGSVRGVNIAAAVRGLDAARQGRLDLEAFSSSASTDFTELLGQFTVRDGVASLGEFHLSSPLVRATGSGALDIAGQSVDLRLEPRAVASIEGQGGAGDLSGLGVPLRISGSWGAVEAGIDEAALQRLLARQAVDAVGDDAARAVDDALGAGAGDLLRGALGLPGRSGQDDAPASEEQDADSAGAQEDPTEEEDDPAEQLLRGLFGDPD